MRLVREKSVMKNRLQFLAQPLRQMFFPLRRLW